MAVRDLRPIKELGFGRQGQITANRTIRQDPPSVGERLYLGSLKLSTYSTLSRSQIGSCYSVCTCLRAGRLGWIAAGRGDPRARFRGFAGSVF
ncbi:hypothetical protein P167DRAFT_370615 [Morchella conica CCBAS932]|uniref:Uncharacterized protein n=1 Tax=Morchella conica CCBAS932 TaxID=1392247 RepID=A0A3N4KC07_9PEZI|nr:hypothetical protein P167DRAFT_370615 [Morchella conica CCBAS932]